MISRRPGSALVLRGAALGSLARMPLGLLVRVHHRVRRGVGGLLLRGLSETLSCSLISPPRAPPCMPVGDRARPPAGRGMLSGRNVRPTSPPASEGPGRARHPVSSRPSRSGSDLPPVPMSVIADCSAVCPPPPAAGLPLLPTASSGLRVTVSEASSVSRAISAFRRPGRPRRSRGRSPRTPSRAGLLLVADLRAGSGGVSASVCVGGVLALHARGDPGGLGLARRIALEVGLGPGRHADVEGRNPGRDPDRCGRVPPQNPSAWVGCGLVRPWGAFRAVDPSCGPSTPIGRRDGCLRRPRASGRAGLLSACRRLRLARAHQRRRSARTGNGCRAGPGEASGWCCTEKAGRSVSVEPAIRAVEQRDVGLDGVSPAGSPDRPRSRGSSRRSRPCRWSCPSPDDWRRDGPGPSSRSGRRARGPCIWWPRQMPKVGTLRVEQLADHRHRIFAGRGRIAGAVRQEHAVRLQRQDVVGARGRPARR